jgi:hypothetical protein
MFNCLAIICGEFELLPVLKEFDAERVRATAIAVVRFRLTAEAQGVPAGCDTVLVAMLRSEAEFFGAELDALEVDGMGRWKEAFDRIGNPCVDAGRIAEELAIPLKLVLERVHYQPAVIALEDAVAESSDDSSADGD